MGYFPGSQCLKRRGRQHATHVEDDCAYLTMVVVPAVVAAAAIAAICGAAVSSVQFQASFVVKAATCVTQTFLKELRTIGRQERRQSPHLF